MYLILKQKSSTTLPWVISNVRHRVIGIQTVCGSLSLHKHCEMQSCAEKDYFRTVGLSLKFHPLAFVVHSKGREDKQVHMYKEIVPRLRVRSLLKHRPVTLGTLGL